MLKKNNIISVIISHIFAYFIYAWIGTFCSVIEITGAYYTYPLCALNGMGRLSIGTPIIEFSALFLD